MFTIYSNDNNQYTRDLTIQQLFSGQITIILTDNCIRLLNSLYENSVIADVSSVYREVYKIILSVPSMSMKCFVE